MGKDAACVRWLSKHPITSHIQASSVVKLAVTDKTINRKKSERHLAPPFVFKASRPSLVVSSISPGHSIYKPLLRPLCKNSNNLVMSSNTSKKRFLFLNP